MWAFLGVLVGIIAGIFLPYKIPVAYSSYTAVAILAALDTVFGGLKAYLEGNFNTQIFISGFFGNALLAGLLAYIGDLLGVPIYLAAIFAFGTRLFNNFATIRRYVIKKGH
ncbi:Small basic protein [Caldanaerobius fijiensis DSM 17918]|uniref:Small basic protein n=1 Tax=Caldanaerobius fijiensis DSM 17918 TaxID=1121256 RepID=A0A1M4T1T1_9THEO|nr:small basic family protein [Caldanaerobius fijiensis]SHE38462.1 Small basic protein [Caldanaerobius fijiensis DSM 17918]